MTEEFIHIVRIAGTDIDGNKPLKMGLLKVKGISHAFAHAIVEVSNLDGRTKLGNLSDTDIEKINDVIENLDKYNIPSWMYNRKRDLETGKNIHMTMSDLDLRFRDDINRLQRIKSYRGFRHRFGLPCRGQRTKASFRKGAVLGVVRKKV